MLRYVEKAGLRRADNRDLSQLCHATAWNIFSAALFVTKLWNLGQLCDLFPLFEWLEIKITKEFEKIQKIWNYEPGEELWGIFLPQLFLLPFGVFFKNRPIFIAMDFWISFSNLLSFSCKLINVKNKF